MEFEILPSLPHAHQQIRLGDVQASKHQWTCAIEFYIRAIEYFKVIETNLLDFSLISVIQAQIIQCEKTIDLCRLKDQLEQTIKAEHLLKTNSSTKSNRIRSNHDNINSLSPLIFPQTNEETRIIAKKNRKHDAHKIEELQISYDALKTHLKAAFDDIERLKYENNQLRLQQEMNSIQEENDSRLLTDSDDEEEEDPETELEATL